MKTFDRSLKHISRISGYLEIAGKVELDNISDAVGMPPSEFYTKTQCQPPAMENARTIAGRREPTCWRLCSPVYSETKIKSLRTYFEKRLAPVAPRIRGLATRKNLRVEFVVTLDRDEDESFHSIVFLNREFLDLLSKLGANVMVDCLW